MNKLIQVHAQGGSPKGLLKLGQHRAAVLVEGVQGRVRCKATETPPSPSAVTLCTHFVHSELVGAACAALNYPLDLNTGVGFPSGPSHATLCPTGLTACEKRDIGARPVRYQGCVCPLPGSNVSTWRTLTQ